MKKERKYGHIVEQLSMGWKSVPGFMIEVAEVEMHNGCGGWENRAVFC